MNRGHNQWKPQIGFTPSNKVGSLDDAGHRMLSYVFLLFLEIMFGFDKKKISTSVKTQFCGCF